MTQRNKRYTLGFLALAAIVFSSGIAFSQPKPAKSEPYTSYRGTAAFAELTLRKAELDSELESLLLSYTDEFPRVVELRQHLVFIEAERSIISGVKTERQGSLTVALGKLMLKRAELRTELWKLLLEYKEEFPDVKRSKRRIEIYDRAVKEILEQ